MVVVADVTFDLAVGDLDSAGAIVGCVGVDEGRVTDVVC